MRTIRDYLKEVNREELLNYYVYEYTFSNHLLDKRYRNITIGELIDREKARIGELIERLISIPTKPNEKKMIIMTVHSAGDGDLEHIFFEST